MENTEERDAPPSPNRQVPPFASNFSQVSKTPPTLRSAACKKPRVDNKPNKRRKRLSDESVGLAKALSTFVETFAKIEAMKFEIQTEMCFENYEKFNLLWLGCLQKLCVEVVVVVAMGRGICFKKLRGGQREKI